MEEDLETAELKEKIDERIEEMEEKASPKWVRYLSLSTAIVAVFAAVASLQSGAYSNEAILEKSEAMLNQSKASDQWAFFQAKGVKASIANGEAHILDGKPEIVADLEAKAKKYEGEQEKIKDDAQKLEEKVKENDEASEHLMHKHHKFAYTVTFLQIAIALSAIAALTRKQWMWYLGLLVSAGGIVNFVLGFM
jgi:uncharacterized membrane protein YdbT with pleckstrin-like domain